MILHLFATYPQLHSHAMDMVKDGSLDAFSLSRWEGVTKAGERHRFDTYSKPKDITRWLGLDIAEVRNHGVPLDDIARAFLTRGREKRAAQAT